MDEYTLLRVKKSFRERLRKFSRKGDTWTDVLTRLLEQVEQIEKEGVEKNE
ncbi:MAG: hypothetical protein ACQXXE_08725 [Candidatus Bathyarchaeia archaeon]|jgi:hypothetical protein